MDMTAIKCGHIPVFRDWRKIHVSDLTRGERVCRFIETYLKVPEGAHVGQPLKLARFQEAFILSIYDNPHKTNRAYLSIARKNAKSATIAALTLAHIMGPEAKENSQIISGARSRDQAALVFNLMQKMIVQSEVLSAKGVTRITPSRKMITGLAKNVEYRAISADAHTSHGLSPVLAILDETGQIKGPHDDFVEAITTSQGAYDDPLLIAISTQAATDNDLFSRWLDDAAHSKDPRIVSHVYAAPADCDLLDQAAWRAANPALGVFRSLRDLESQAKNASRMPSAENGFRNYCLNQRVETFAPFISRSLWAEGAAPVGPLKDGDVLYGGLDLSSVSDLTALVLLQAVDDAHHVHATFWLPEDGLLDKAKADRVPYDIWHGQGYLDATPGRAIDYEFVAQHLFDLSQRYDLRKVAFDRWNFKQLRPCLVRAGFADEQLEGEASLFEPFGQGFVSMSPALRILEGAFLAGRIVHGDHPVLGMCAANAITVKDAAGNMKLTKEKSRGRIDGMIALAMAISTAETCKNIDNQSVYETRGVLML